MGTTVSEEPDPQPLPRKSQPLSEAELKSRLIKAYERTREGMVERIEREYAFGLAWLGMKRHVIDTLKQKIEKWIEKNPLPFSYTYAAGCARVAANYYNDFLEAHEWRESDEAVGWPPTKKASGWEYVEQVVKQYRQFQHDPVYRPETSSKRKATTQASPASEEDRVEHETDESAEAISTPIGNHTDEESEAAEVVQFSEQDPATLRAERDRLWAEIAERQERIAVIDRLLNEPMH